FAAKLIVPESVKYPEVYYHNNVEKFSVLLDAVAAAKVPHVIFSSTAAVYGEPEIVPVTEDAKCAPINPYGATKLRAEEILSETTQKNNMHHVTLRYFNVAGADPAGRSGQMMPDATHLIKIAAEVALRKRPGMQIFGTDYATPDGTCIRDYIHVSDLADAHVKALQYLQAGGESTTLNCGYGHGYSVAEVVDMVSAAIHAPLPVTMADRRGGDPAMLVADSSKLRALLQWAPIYDNLRDIVRSALAWEVQVENIRAQQKNPKAA
ncbi:MAG TPA: UDP-glucose 4-epimerase GalE, partial [Alphaproteobacteria bacterium]|nr:UDP-glucose 4-epimerase GalE [Alphaproteobacteria bacterium]